MTATAEAIRDRVITLIEAQTPTLLPHDRFRAYRNEGGADLFDWAQKNTAGAFRRTQVRALGEDQPPAVSNMLVEERILELQVAIAYPQDARAGRNNALDRDDAIVADWKKIDFAIGICGGGNFSGSADCTPLGCTKSIERVGKVDFLMIKARFQFWCSTS